MINIIQLNGSSSNYDFEELKESIINSISPTCKHAQIYLFNAFPYSLSTDVNIDLLFILNIQSELHNNYFRFTKNNENYNIKNLIIPISFVNNCHDLAIEKEDDNFVLKRKLGDELLDYSRESNDLKFETMKYLKDRCNFKSNPNIIPLVFIKNKLISSSNESIIIDSKFSFNSILESLHCSVSNYGTSYKEWVGLNKGAIEGHIHNIYLQASKDSEYGYLTKDKIEKTNRYYKFKELEKELGKQTIIIKGKAGSGKTSLLIDLLKSTEKIKRNSLFLSYNRMLIYDLAMIIRSFENFNNKKSPSQKNKEHSTQTLHSFFYRLSKNLGVLLLMSDKRIIELKDKLNSRLDLIFIELEKIVKYQINDMNADKIKEYFQNKRFSDDPKENNGIKVEAINLINSLSKDLVKKQDIKDHLIKYKDGKINKITEKEGSKLFLEDYYGVLQNLHNVINDKDKFISDFKIQDKFDLLGVPLNLNKYTEEKNGKTQINLKEFKIRLRRGYGGTRRRRIVFLDEGQDCHILEKKIIYSLFGTENIVVASGGKEQLIRHHEVRDWSVDHNNKLLIHKVVNKQNKSFRLKKNLAHFCNYIAEYYKIDLNLETKESNDHGSVILDFRNNSSQHKIDEIESLRSRGKISGCKDYENLMILREPILASNSQNKGRNSIKINQYDNIEIKKLSLMNKWDMKLKLEEDLGFVFWDKTEEAEGQFSISPGFSMTRLLNYESCRGLESWTVSCFSLEKFFERKQNEDDAEKFLVQQDLEFETNNDRRKRYAATWVLMALTRATDTLHINLDDKDSEFSQLLIRYSLDHPNYISLKK
jgi:hypothetical protein